MWLFECFRMAWMSISSELKIFNEIKKCKIFLRLIKGKTGQRLTKKVLVSGRPTGSFFLKIEFFFENVRIHVPCPCACLHEIVHSCTWWIKLQSERNFRSTIIVRHVALFLVDLSLEHLTSGDHCPSLQGVLPLLEVNRRQKHLVSVSRLLHLVQRAIIAVPSLWFCVWHATMFWSMHILCIYLYQSSSVKKKNPK